MKKLILVALGIIMFSGLYAQKADVVKISSGKISGIKTPDESVRIFKGIPFAAPPVGDLRWKAPQPVKPWSDIRNCATPPPSAMQAKPTPFYCWSREFLAPESPLSEDCLYLNVWTPAKSGKEKLPVIVWIHGGAFTGGSGTVPLYDGEEMARKGVVFITINYRLGIFGFLAHPQLSAESPDHVSGNYGILDQMAALKWVQKNIAAFGGNPDNVTIAGQSAGAFSVNMLVVSPFARGLFHKVIAHSGGMFGKSPSLGQTLKAMEESGAQVMGKLGVSNISELRALPAEKMMTVQGRWGIAIDNVVIPPVYETFAQGKQSDVPTISGWNADDGVSFGPAPNAEAFVANLKRQYGEKAPDFLQYFPAGSDEEAAKSQKLLSQLFFGWNNYAWASMQTTHGKQKAFLYYFTHVPPGEPNYGAFHSAEFGYALKTLKFWNRPFTNVDFELSDQMSSYWVNFARTGNPNGEGLPVWPAFNNTSPQVIELGDEVKAIPLPFKEQLYFFDKIN